MRTSTLLHNYSQYELLKSNLDTIELDLVIVIGCRFQGFKEPVAGGGCFLHIIHNQRAEIHFPESRLAMSLPGELPSNTQLFMLVCLDLFLLLFYFYYYLLM